MPSKLTMRCPDCGREVYAVPGEHTLPGGPPMCKGSHSRLQPDTYEHADIRYDKAFVAGLKAGWQFCANEDDDGMRQAVEQRLKLIREVEAD